MDDERRTRVGVPAVVSVRRGLAAVVDGLDPDDVPVADVSGLWKAFDEIERLAASAKLLLAVRVDESGAWRHAGARSAAEHLATLGATSVGAARRMLATSEQVAGLTEITDAVHGGVLSAGQVEAIAGAASADPAAERRLLWLAHTTNVTELREECLRTKVAADPDPEATHRRIHRERRATTCTDAEGGWNLTARGTAEMGARYERAVAPIIKEMFDRARAEGRHEPREAYAFDALIALAERASGPDTPSGTNPNYLAVLRVDVAALTRGAVDDDETCEIVGIGPVPVTTARDLLGEAILKLVITKGVDVGNVTHLGRGPTAAQRVALLWTTPKCANVACSATIVQIDHRIPWADTHHTRLDQLDPLCPHHHKLKTNQHWALEPGTGRPAFVPPTDQRHPNNRPPP